MSTVEQLQQIGLNKYEAEAYYTLLAEGPLTGYELGKRSQVPLSRSYEILERLAQKGLALVQPGDPPRYLAEDPKRFLGQVRQTMTTTLDALADSLSTLSHAETASEFWVIRGRQHIVARAKAMIADAQRSISLLLPPGCEAELSDVLALAQKRGCSIFRSSSAAQGDAEMLLLLIDECEALAGLLHPADRCQAVVSSNQALVAPLSSYFTRQIPAKYPVPVASFEASQQNDPLNWVAWEDRKQRHLWSLTHDHRVA
jgi:HTH-type transcriptional regulator, sugar sensing transcriptional regulator